jgi:acetyltransferase-like isoleucine patch superfamily enzyme
VARDSGDATVHETAIVEAGAAIGAGTRVWHHAHVRAGAVIGAGCTIGKNVFVDSGAQLGDRVKVQNNVSVYSGVVIEDEVFVGPSVVFTNDRTPRATSTEWVLTPTAVRRGASLGANATIIAGVVVREFAMVAAGAVVTKDVERHQLVAGNPARPISWVCRCGNTRVGLEATQLRCGDCATDIPVPPRHVETAP